MDEHEELAVRFRQRAAELRAMIPDMKDQQVRETLEKVAAGYDKLAIGQENLAKAAKTAATR